MSSKMNKIVGFILVSPAILSVLAFFIKLMGVDILSEFEYADIWIGDHSGEGSGFSSSLPFYFGLMAIAGAIILKENLKENHDENHDDEDIEEILKGTQK